MLDHYFREPFMAALIAAAVTMAYVFVKSKISNQATVKNSEYFRPATLVAILVFFIVKQGQTDSSPYLTDPY